MIKFLLTIGPLPVRRITLVLEVMSMYKLRELGTFGKSYPNSKVDLSDIFESLVSIETWVLKGVLSHKFVERANWTSSFIIIIHIFTISRICLYVIYHLCQWGKKLYYYTLEFQCSIRKSELLIENIKFLDSCVSSVCGYKQLDHKPVLYT